MIAKNAIMTTTLSLVAVLAIGANTESNNAFAKEASPIWKTTFVSNELPQHEFPTAGNVHALTTFTFEGGQEVIDFPLCST